MPFQLHEGICGPWSHSAGVVSSDGSQSETNWFLSFRRFLGVNVVLLRSGPIYRSRIIWSWASSALLLVAPLALALALAFAFVPCARLWVSCVAACRIARGSVGNDHFGSFRSDRRCSCSSLVFLSA